MDEYIDEQILQDHEETQDFPKKKKGFVLSKPTYYALICIFSAVFVLCGVYLGGYFWETSSAQDDYDVLASIYEQVTRPTGTVPSEPVGSVPTETQPLSILPELQPIYELNNDLIGYLNFPYVGLNLKYPVMQTPANDNFYLSHDFYGNESIAGCPYVPKSCDVFAPSDNIVIYGHNLKTGGMFGNLTYYKEKSFWETHQTFYFDTLYERHTYQIFAVFKTAAKQFTEDGKPWGYPFHRINNFATEAEFDKFIADVKGAAFNGGDYRGWTFYDTGITPQYGDKLLCLTTCEYTMKDPDGTVNGRWVVIAVRID